MKDEFKIYGRSVLLSFGMKEVLNIIVMKRIAFYLFFGMALFFGSCSKNMCDCFTSLGSIITEERSIEDFTSIRMEGNINVILCHDSICHIKVECGSGIINEIQTEVTNNRLRIWNTSSCNWVRDLDPKINVYVFYKTLQEINYSSIGNITNTDTLNQSLFTLNVRDGGGSIKLKINCDTAFFNEHDGTADISLSGKVKNQYIYNNGMGLINAKEVLSSFTYVNNRGTNDCYVNAKNRLEARIEYYGNIYYLGSPLEIISWINGEGKLIKL